MTLPASGSISINDILVELGKNPGDEINLNDPDLLELAGKSAGEAITFPADFYGKSLFGTHEILVNSVSFLSSAVRYGAIDDYFTVSALGLPRMSPNTIYGEPMGGVYASYSSGLNETIFSINYASDTFDGEYVDENMPFLIDVQFQRTGPTHTLKRNTTTSLSWSLKVSGQHADYSYLVAKLGETIKVLIDETRQPYNFAQNLNWTIPAESGGISFSGNTLITSGNSSDTGSLGLVDWLGAGVHEDGLFHLNQQVKFVLIVPPEAFTLSLSGVRVTVIDGADVSHSADESLLGSSIGEDVGGGYRKIELSVNVSSATIKTLKSIKIWNTFSAATYPIELVKLKTA